MLNAICLKEAAGNEGGAKDPVQKQEEKTSGDDWVFLHFTH